MSTTDLAPNSIIHGLDYPPDFLPALPVLRHRLPPHSPIRALTAAQFADIHYAHLTTHAPDHVLFPFLHGLEGDNEQQNAFFAASRPPGAPSSPAPVPSFRGLIWVACESSDDSDDEMCDDMDEFYEEEEEDDDESTSSSLDSFGPPDLADEHDVAMQLDPTVEGPLVSGVPPPDPMKKPGPILSRLTPHPSSHPPPPPLLHTKPVVLTSSFRVRDILRTRQDDEKPQLQQHVFVDPRIPDGISLRNFGIQVPVYATISDIVLYSPRGHTRHAIAAADKFKQAVELKYQERCARAAEPDALVRYNVFVLDASPAEINEKLSHLVVRTENASGPHTDRTDAHAHGESAHELALRANTVEFAQRERDEMRDLTQSSEIVSVIGPESSVDPDILAGSNTAMHWQPAVGQIFLGNSNDVPLSPQQQLRMRAMRAGEDEDNDVYDWRNNDPSLGYGYDLCIECHDYAPFPTSAHLRAAEEHVRLLDKRWIERCVNAVAEGELNVDPKDPVQPRPPPNAGHVVHLPFPSSPASSVGTVNTLLPFVQFLERMVQPVEGGLTYDVARELLCPPPPPHRPFGYGHDDAYGEYGSGTPSSLPPPSAFPTSFFTASPSTSNPYTRVRSTSATFLPGSNSAPTLVSTASASPSTSTSASTSASASASTSACTSPSTPGSTQPPVALRTRPLKILIYSADGYTESSVLALCILMAFGQGMSLPEAYVTLQVDKRRSFFVYQSDLSVLRRFEARLEKERRSKDESQGGAGPGAMVHPLRTRSESEAHAHMLSLTTAPANNALTLNTNLITSATAGRPRAKTLPAPARTAAPWGDHGVWFNDPRFDGSFPSRVLPFLYLGNLNHASNAAMLHALGITHVVSVGECALAPPPNACASANGAGEQVSLWLEEREGRIKVLDIKGVCDDGIDTLEPQLEPVCEWIERAREEGGKVLVHCRVGVSRSATVTIAYVMKHLGLPLVDAYLVVRSRRLSVLIQPNMRLLYNLVGWEIRLARERAEKALLSSGTSDAADEGVGEEVNKKREEQLRARIRNELGRALNWPFLAREVHALNEKYLH